MTSAAVQCCYKYSSSSQTNFPAYTIPLPSTHRDESSLERVLALLVRHITNPRYAMTLTCVALLVADMYAGVLGESEVVDELFGKLK